MTAIKDNIANLGYTLPFDMLDLHFPEETQAKWEKLPKVRNLVSPTDEDLAAFKELPGFVEGDGPIDDELVRSGRVHLVHYLVKLCPTPKPSDLDIDKFRFVLGGLIDRGVPQKVLAPSFTLPLTEGRCIIGCCFTVHLPGKNFEETRLALNADLGFNAFVREGEFGEDWGRESLPR